MHCVPEKLRPDETTMLHVLNWMEQAYDNTCWVMDADLKKGSVCLFGPQSQQFTAEFNEIMAEVYSKVPAWREW